MRRILVRTIHNLSFAGVPQNALCTSDMYGIQINEKDELSIQLPVSEVREVIPHFVLPPNCEIYEVDVRSHNSMHCSVKTVGGSIVLGSVTGVNVCNRAYLQIKPSSHSEILYYVPISKVEYCVGLDGEIIRNINRLMGDAL